MKTKRLRKSGSVANTRWATYATAAAASTFAAAHSTEAMIHYSGLIKYDFDGFRSQSHEFRFPGVALFFNRIINYTGTNYSYNGFDDHFAVVAQAGGSVAGFFYTCAYSTSVASVSNLGRGDAISQRPFVPDGGILMTVDGLGCGGGWRGQFFADGTALIGFRFNRGHGVQYGWARIKVDWSPSQRYEVMDYAYADPGEPIRAGQTSSNEMVPEEGSLGALAMGAAGLLAWRKRRSQAAP